MSLLTGSLAIFSESALCPYESRRSMGAILRWYGELQVKITNVETLVADGGWRPWIFVKIETDEGRNRLRGVHRSQVA